VSSVEIETTLVICSDSPETIVREVAKLTEVGRYVLVGRSDLAIRDVYLDLGDGSLRSHGLGLRVRFVDGDPFVTLKGRPEDVEGGGLRREEIELPWSTETKHTVVSRLSACGLELGSLPSNSDMADPVAAFYELGFYTDQRRSTIRRPRDVILGEGPADVRAEMAIDSVVFHLENGDVGHREIEIEVKGTGNVEGIQEVSRELVARIPSVLLPWPHGKRSTGKAAESLIAERGSAGIVSPSGDLLPAAYDLIADRLR
jgi:inorganic triphosphatase YgiF